MARVCVTARASCTYGPAQLTAVGRHLQTACNHKRTRVTKRKRKKPQLQIARKFSEAEESIRAAALVRNAPCDGCRVLVSSGVLT